MISNSDSVLLEPGFSKCSHAGYSSFTLAQKPSRLLNIPGVSFVHKITFQTREPFLIEKSPVLLETILLCCTVGKPKNSSIYFIPGYTLHMLSVEWSLVLLAV